MEWWMPGMIRHIFQHHMCLEDEAFRTLFVKLLDLNEDEIEALEAFRSQVCDHVLERLQGTIPCPDLSDWDPLD